MSEIEENTSTSTSTSTSSNGSSGGSDEDNEIIWGFCPSCTDMPTFTWVLGALNEYCEECGHEDEDNTTCEPFYFLDGWDFCHCEPGRGRLADGRGRCAKCNNHLVDKFLEEQRVAREAVELMRRAEGRGREPEHPARRWRFAPASVGRCPYDGCDTFGPIGDECEECYNAFEPDNRFWVFGQW